MAYKKCKDKKKQRIKKNNENKMTQKMEDQLENGASVSALYLLAE